MQRTWLRSYLKANEKEILEMLREEALLNLTNLQVQVAAVRRWIINLHLQRVWRVVKERYFKRVVIFRLFELRAQRARFVAERFRFWTVVKYGSLDKKHLNKMRHELIFNGICMKEMTEWRCKRKILLFLVVYYGELSKTPLYLFLPLSCYVILV